MLMRRLRQGFTLIEMLVVLAIIALLLSISLPRYFGSLNRSKDLVLQENLQTLRITIDKFFSDKGRYPDSLDVLVQENYLRALPIDPITDSNQTWILVPPLQSGKTGVADVKSGADGTATDGRTYASY